MIQYKRIGICFQGKKSYFRELGIKNHIDNTLQEELSLKEIQLNLKEISDSNCSNSFCIVTICNDTV